MASFGIIISEFINKFINPIIIVWFLGLWVYSIILKNKLSRKKDLIEDAVSRKNKKYVINSNTQTVDSFDDSNISITPDTIRKHEKEFNSFCTGHALLIQLITILPLLGILGTVAGIMLELNNTSDTEKMLSSLYLALSSTLYGLLASIFLKVYDSLNSSKIINDTEVLLEDYNNKLNLSKVMNQNSKIEKEDL
jgi:biopolymer transport protein ExbB/TolQ